MAGEYRTEAILNQLPAAIAHAIRNDGLRIALTAHPMVRVVRRGDLRAMLVEAYANIPGMEKYVEGLRTGGMVPVVEMQGDNRVWVAGELYFKS